ncbi:hypothetical protein [Novosphingobium guangzhouense]|uniref:hypothetical protein n=1 Tax=Novosphingobium guangzhouense TaxID=1850347 RepID=UPI0011AEF70D|nr:hypothetical protein [Novosphingobium guangzhouense]
MNSEATNLVANVNNSQCIVEKGHWGYDTFLNICTGSHVDIPWTLGDYMGVGVAAVLSGLMAAAAVLLVAAIVR